DSARRAPLGAALAPGRTRRLHRARNPRSHALALLHAAHAGRAGDRRRAPRDAADVDAGAALSGGAAALARARAGGRPRAERAQRARDAAPARLPVRRRGQARVSQTRAPKVVVVMPAYNAGRTLRMTYEQLPKDTVNLVILVDDGSTDATLDVARQLGLEIFVHNRNYGYGANQKTCYTEALHAGADVVVMVHPDYQYDPTLVPQIVEPITRGAADVVLGSRLKSGSALAQGMPWWKFVANRFLTWVENRAFGLRLSEYHTGYRAFRREVLETVNFRANADGFIFDQEIIAQVVAAQFRIAEIPVPTRYFPEASSASFLASTVYGLRILAVVFWYLLSKWGVRRSRRFDSLRARYTRLRSRAPTAGWPGGPCVRPPGRRPSPPRG